MATNEQGLNKPNFPQPFFADFMAFGVRTESDIEYLSGEAQCIQDRLFGIPASAEYDRRPGHLELLFKMQLETLKPDYRQFCEKTLPITVTGAVLDTPNNLADRHPTTSFIEEPALAGIRLVLHYDETRGVYAVQAYDYLTEGTMIALAVDNNNLAITESVLWGEQTASQEPATTKQLVVVTELVERLLQHQPIRR